MFFSFGKFALNKKVCLFVSGTKKFFCFFKLIKWVVAEDKKNIKLCKMHLQYYGSLTLNLGKSCFQFPKIEKIK